MVFASRIAFGTSHGELTARVRSDPCRPDLHGAGCIESPGKKASTADRSGARFSLIGHPIPFGIRSRISGRLGLRFDPFEPVDPSLERFFDSRKLHFERATGRHAFLEHIQRGVWAVARRILGTLDEVKDHKHLFSAPRFVPQHLERRGERAADERVISTHGWRSSEGISHTHVVIYAAVSDINRQSLSAVRRGGGRS